MSTKRYTVFGSSGFIGKALTARLKTLGYTEGFFPRREDKVEGRDLGVVFYCAGMTGDFLENLSNLAEVHVSKLIEISESNRIESIVCLSSTRIYGEERDARGPANENEPLVLTGAPASKVYDVSKILGEQVLQVLGEKYDFEVCIFRLSNVLGYDPESPNSIWSLIREFVNDGALTFLSSRDSAKDYVDIDSVIEVLVSQLKGFRSGVFNLASGVNTTNEQVSRFFPTDPGAETIHFSDENVRRMREISIQKLEDSFGIRPRTGLENLERMIERYGSDSHED